VIGDGGTNTRCDDVGEMWTCSPWTISASAEPFEPCELSKPSSVPGVGGADESARMWAVTLCAVLGVDGSGDTGDGGNAALISELSPLGAGAREDARDAGDAGPAVLEEYWEPEPTESGEDSGEVGGEIGVDASAGVCSPALK
jgi:hypothetical protein